MFDSISRDDAILKRLVWCWDGETARCMCSIMNRKWFFLIYVWLISTMMLQKSNADWLAPQFTDISGVLKWPTEDGRHNFIRVEPRNEEEAFNPATTLVATWVTSLSQSLSLSLSTILDAPYINQNSISNILGYLESLAIFSVCFYYIDTKCTWASVCVCVCVRWHVSKLPFVIARKYFEALRAQFPNWNWGKITKISAILIQLVPLCDCSTCEWVWVCVRVCVRWVCVLWVNILGTRHATFNFWFSLCKSVDTNMRQLFMALGP